MDEQDFALVARLCRSPTASHAELGRAIGASPATARRRLARLREEGVLRGFVALPAAECFGREAWVCDFSDPVPVRADLPGLLRVEPVVWADRNRDGSVAVMSYVTRGAKPPAAELGALLGVAPARTYRYPPPAASRPEALGPLQWRVVEALVRDPRARLEHLAASAGLSPKTFRRHRDALAREGLVDTFPLLGPPQGPGLQLYHLSVDLDDAARVPQVAKALPHAVLFHHLEEPPGAYFVCRAATLAEFQGMASALAARPGVRRVRVVLNEAFEVAEERLRGWARAERARWAAAARAR